MASYEELLKSAVRFDEAEMRILYDRAEILTRYSQTGMYGPFSHEMMTAMLEFQVACLKIRLELLKDNTPIPGDKT